MARPFHTRPAARKRERAGRCAPGFEALFGCVLMPTAPIAEADGHWRCIPFARGVVAHRKHGLALEILTASGDIAGTLAVWVRTTSPASVPAPITRGGDCAPSACKPGDAGLAGTGSDTMPRMTSRRIPAGIAILGGPGPAARWACGAIRAEDIGRQGTPACPLAVRAASTRADLEQVARRRQVKVGATGQHAAKLTMAPRPAGTCLQPQLEHPAESSLGRCGR